MKKFLLVLLTLVLILTALPEQEVSATGSFNGTSDAGDLHEAAKGYEWGGDYGARISIVNRNTGVTVGGPMDFANSTITKVKLCFQSYSTSGLTNKLQYMKSGTIKRKEDKSCDYFAGRLYDNNGLALELPRMVSASKSKGGAVSRKDVLDFFTDDDVQRGILKQLQKWGKLNSGLTIDKMWESRNYYIMVEPVVYTNIDRKYTAMTATEVGLWELEKESTEPLKMKSKLPSLAYQNLPLSLFLESTILGIQPYTGNNTKIENPKVLLKQMGVCFIVFGGGDADYDGGGFVTRYIDNNYNNTYDSGDTLIDNNQFAYNYSNSSFGTSPYIVAKGTAKFNAGGQQGYLRLPYSGATFNFEKYTRSGVSYTLRSGYVKEGSSTKVTVRKVPETKPIDLWKLLGNIPSNGTAVWYLGYQPADCYSVTTHRVDIKGNELDSPKVHPNVKKGKVVSFPGDAPVTKPVGAKNYSLYAAYYVGGKFTKADTYRKVGDSNGRITQDNIKNTNFTMPANDVDLYFVYGEVKPDPIKISYLCYWEMNNNNKYDEGVDVPIPNMHESVYNGLPTCKDYNIRTNGKFTAPSTLAVDNKGTKLGSSLYYSYATRGGKASPCKVKVSSKINEFEGFPVSEVQNRSLVASADIVFYFAYQPNAPKDIDITVVKYIERGAEKYYENSYDVLVSKDKIATVKYSANTSYDISADGGYAPPKTITKNGKVFTLYMSYGAKQGVTTEIKYSKDFKSDGKSYKDLCKCSMKKTHHLTFYFGYKQLDETDDSDDSDKISIKYVNYIEKGNNKTYNSGTDTKLDSATLYTGKPSEKLYGIVSNGKYKAPETKKTGSGASAKKYTLYYSYATKGDTVEEKPLIYSAFDEAKGADLAKVRDRTVEASDNIVFYFAYKELEEPEATEKVTVMYLDEKGNALKPKDVIPIKSSEVGKTIKVSELDVEVPQELGTAKIKTSTVAPTNNLGNETKYTVKEFGGTKTPAVVINRSFKLVKGGITIVYYYTATDTNVLGKQNGQSSMHADAHGVIRADNRNSEKFNVDEGIPTTETLYTCLQANNYIYSFATKTVKGTKNYTVTITQPYDYYPREWVSGSPKYDWVIENGKKVWKQVGYYEGYWNYLSPQRKSTSTTITVSREYLYYVLSQFDVYALESGEVTSGALGGKCNLTPTGYTAPTAGYVHKNAESAHIFAPDATGSASGGNGSYSITLPQVSVYAPNSSPSMPSATSLKSMAENAVGKIKVKNDKAVFNGTVLLSDEMTVNASPINASALITGQQEISNTVLFKSGLMIPANCSNGTKASQGTVTYRKVSTASPSSDPLDSTGPTKHTESFSLNDVIVHTPVVCSVQISNNNRMDQRVNEKGTNAWVLDTKAAILLSYTGQHNSIPGYGYRNYAKYVRDTKVTFPFDVYRNGTYVPKGTEISLNEGITDFYLPTWIPTGTYSYRITTTAINAGGGGEPNANTNLSNYTAYEDATIEIVGRLYGLTLYDMAGKKWEPVFRTSTGGLTGYTYSNGFFDENGNKDATVKNTYPVVVGDNPKSMSSGPLKTGYSVRFALNTVGDFAGDKDMIQLIPHFYFIPYDNLDERIEVDLYYSTTVNGWNKLLKVGGKADLTNIKSFKPNDSVISIPKVELNKTLALLGITEEKQQKIYLTTKSPLYRYSMIYSSNKFRTFTGAFTSNITGKLPLSRLSAMSTPSSLTNTSAKSVQTWYGEYSIPSSVHVVKKGYDLSQYDSFKYNEPYWLKKGYILVNFEIYAIKDNQRYLAYYPTNGSDRGNMWAVETGSSTGNTSKTDTEGRSFDFRPGDFILYYADKSIKDDYGSGGTH